MHRDDLLSEVQRRARLHGRNHARRVVQAVLAALHQFVPDAVFRNLTRQLPPGVDVAPAGPAVEDACCRTLVRDVARRLHVAEPDAAFYARVTFEQLNAFCRGVTPARIAPSLPADLRALVSAQADDPVQRHRVVLRTMSSAAPLGLRPAPAAPAPLTEVVIPDPRPKRTGSPGRVPGTG